MNASISAFGSDFALYIALGVCAIIVVIGVALEAIEDIHKVKETYAWHEKDPWKLVAAKVGLALLVLGLCGETIFQVWIEHKDTHFRADAAHRISTLSDKAESLRKEANKARLEEEKLRTANLALEKILRPRRINLDQPGLGVELRQLKSFAGTPVLIDSVSDLEALRAAHDLGFILFGSGWKVSFRVETPVASLQFPDGIWVAVHVATPRRGEWQIKSNRKPDVSPAEQAVNRFLSAVQINNIADFPLLYRSRPWVIPPTGTLLIIVGMKPTWDQLFVQDVKEYNRFVESLKPDELRSLKPNDFEGFLKERR